MVAQPWLSAMSAACFNSTILPPRLPPSAVMSSLAPASSKRSLSDSAEKPPNIFLQFGVTDAANVAFFTFEENGGLIPSFTEMAIEAVERYVQHAFFEPLITWRFAAVERRLERSLPGQFAPGQIGPETGVIGGGTFVQGVQLRSGLDARLARELGRGRE